MWGGKSRVVYENSSVHLPPLSAGGVELPTKFSKRGGLTKSQLWEGVAGKEGGGGHGGLQYYKQTKAKIWNI